LSVIPRMIWKIHCVDEMQLLGLIMAARTLTTGLKKSNISVFCIFCDVIDVRDISEIISAPVFIIMQDKCGEGNLYER
jgi:hypothetical protein